MTGKEILRNRMWRLGFICHAEELQKMCQLIFALDRFVQVIQLRKHCAGQCERVRIQDDRIQNASI